MILEWMEIRCSPVRVTNRTGRQVYDRRLVDSSRLIRTQHVATVCVSATTQRPLIGREAITYVFVSGKRSLWLNGVFIFILIRNGIYNFTLYEIRVLWLCPSLLF